MDRNSSFRILAKEIASMFNTPILLITFNRPAHTCQVLERILEAKPQKLYVFQDGARVGNENDVQKCTEVRQTIDELWNNYIDSLQEPKEQNAPTIHRYYSDVNLGCGPGPATAITWFFSQVEEGIIIEDDAVPHLDFFPYCEELLERYKDDTSVRAIGSMHLDTHTYGDGSYYFSMMNRTLCAWATWARAWKDFDMYHCNVTRQQLNRVLKEEYGCCLRMREYWCDRLAEVQKDALNHTSWDQQFWISIWLHHGKGIMPNVNLSSNIGFDELGTHTHNVNSSGANKKTSAILPLVHPSNTHVRHMADQRFQEIYFEPYEYGWSGFKRLSYRLNKRLKRLLHHEGSWFVCSVL